MIQRILLEQYYKLMSQDVCVIVFCIVLNVILFIFKVHRYICSEFALYK